MKVTIKTVFITALLFVVLLVTTMVVSTSYLQQEHESDLYRLEDHISQLVTMASKPYLERKDFDGLQLLAEDIIDRAGIVYLTIEHGKDILAHAHVPANPNHNVITVPLYLENSALEDVNATVGFQSGSFHSLTGTLGQLAVVSTIGIALLAVLVILAMIILALRPLQRLKKLTTPQGQTAANTNLGFFEDIDQTVCQVADLQNRLEKSYSQLYNSLREQQYSYSEARLIEEQSEAIYKASHDAIIVASDDDTIVEFSPVAEQIFGWKRKDIVGKTMAENIIPPAMREMHKNGMKRFLETGKSVVLNKRIELTAMRRNGTEFPIEISISAAKTVKGHLFVSYIRDISKQLQNQTEMKIAARAFETAQPVFIADNLGRIIRSNPAFSNITGYSAREVIGEKPRSLMTNAKDSRFHKQVWRMLHKKGSWEGEMPFRHKEGYEIPVHLSIVSVTDEKDVLSHYVAHFYDLTDQKRYEANLLEAQQSAENANRAKSRFLAAMSHEIRTPMNGVLGVLGLLKETELNELQRKLVNTARGSGELLLSIINDILDFSKMEAGKLSLENTIFDMYELFGQTVDIVYPQAEKKNLSLTSRIADDVPRYLEGDGDRIRQILLNLLSNAVKYTSVGSVQVKISCIHRHPLSAKLKIDVVDTGIGIDAKHIPTLFEEFTMAESSYNRSHEGSGLGLAICQQLVNLMDGEISVVSELGEGSIFTATMTLNVADEADYQPPAPTDTDTTEIAKDLRILMAEDNPANQMVLRTMLELSGLSVDIVSNGKEAVEAVSSIPYDIVLMDISMPGMDGMEATKHIRALPTSAKDVIIIALTAHALRGDREHFIKLGMDDFVSKPFTRQSIMECLSRWQPRPPSKSEPVTTTLTNDEPALGSSANRDSIQTVDDNAEIMPQEEEPIVNEAVLMRLAADTSPDVVPQLLEFYIRDAKVRIDKIAQAAEDKDYYAIEFEAHTLGSSAGAHGNSHLCSYCREIEKSCLQQRYDDAVSQAGDIRQVADASFAALEARSVQGFTTSTN